MIGYTAGAVVDLLREHLGGQNASSFSTTANTDSDDFQTNAIITAMPSRGTHATDATAYSTQPTATSWNHQLRLRPTTGGQAT